MNIFYSKQKLNDTLIGIAHTANPVDVITTDENDTLFYDKTTNKLIGFNLCNISSQIELENGRLFINEKIRKFVEQRIKQPFDEISNEFVVGEIVECSSIPNTHLSHCVVDIKNERLSVVCGASNVVVGLKVVVAKVGAYMPHGNFIEFSVIHGFNSCGMLCSQKELNLKDFNENGIIELCDKYVKGENFLEIFVCK